MEELRLLLKANKLIYKDSDNLAKFEEALELVEHVWQEISEKDKP